MISQLLALWQKVPAPLRQWLKGAEVAVVSALVSALVLAPVSDLATTEGVVKALAGIASVAYGAFRLYMAQSPLQNVVQQVVASETVKPDGTTTSTVSATTTEAH